MPGPDAILVRYGELALKGGQRGHFERRLAENLRSALAAVPGARVERMRGRLLVRTEGRLEEALTAAARVFGVKSLSPVHRVAATEEAIRGLGSALVGEALARRHPGAGPVRFAVRANRSDRRFPMRSDELAARLGADALRDHPRLTVDLDDPELTLEVDVRDSGAYLFCERIPGPGGLPVGTLGRALCLLSGGIDSPVAAWMAMRRGLRTELVSFVSPPHTGAQTIAKVERLARVLAAWQPVTWLHLAPLTEVQEYLRREAPEPFHTLLDRRSMMRIATHLARRKKLRALVTGDNLGQVASQTLENMTVTDDASDLLVLRPLEALDKEEIIERARAIGTYEVSILPAPDCCTVWLPRSPVLHARRDEVEAVEAALPELADLEYRAVKRATREKITP